MTLGNICDLGARRLVGTFNRAWQRYLLGYVGIGSYESLNNSPALIKNLHKILVVAQGQIIKFFDSSFLTASFFPCLMEQYPCVIQARPLAATG
jgi:hypothetical protein